MPGAGHCPLQAPWSDVQRVLDLITQGDAANFVRHRGYTLQVQ
jgi:hypothetical protein